VRHLIYSSERVKTRATFTTLHVASIQSCLDRQSAGAGGSRSSSERPALITASFLPLELEA